ncbi:hypothetical protein [Klebsiella aerogenes]|uniref:hypothetical protein n=1 Tax=Klebsiella aerogenes TaxID=548 RepID=UPI00044AE495|nr:hypothetical protein [Klebsiella aerogenes]AML34651.1 Ead protein [Klebsiella aerogenes]ATY08473.1 hypothetical protein AM336_24185 [Klebsiella aerogenes]EUL97533.1 hypothetical protein P819_02183 [Klebsiella aerogenes UCI 16]KTH70142.1 hypothetical protein ASV18_14385 [Klebsiella aerogenes]KZQ31593.1 hypothetical protein A3N45_14190 [Klebsiella aerogenes]
MTDINRLIASLKRRSAHVKEFGDDVTFVKLKDIDALVEALEKAKQLATQQGNIACALFDEVTALRQRIAELEEAEQQLCAANVTLDARAEQAERERENWRTSFDNERFRADKLKAHIDDIEPVRAAAEKLVRCKGRYHSEQNYRALAALFGVTTPDLPPLDSESRTVTVKLPADRAAESEVSGYDGTEFYRAGWNARGKADKEALTAAGIKVEAE